MSDEQPPLPDPPPAVPSEPEAPPAPPPVLRYVVADAAGEILRIVHCTADQAAAQAMPGECMLQHDEAASATHHLQSGEAVQAVAYTAAQLAAKAVRPHPSATWDNAAMAWADPRTLAQHRADKWEEIKAARDSAEFGPFAWDGSVFDGDQKSQARIIGKVLAAKLAADNGGGFQQTWKLADNSFRSLDAASMIAVGQALDANISQAHATAAALWLQLQAATTRQEIDAIGAP